MLSRLLDDLSVLAENTLRASLLISVLVGSVMLPVLMIAALLYLFGWR